MFSGVENISISIWTLNLIFEFFKTPVGQIDLYKSHERDKHIHICMKQPCLIVSV